MSRASHATDEQVSKLRARASRVLDLFISLRGKYALLKPLAFDADLARRIGSGPRAHAQAILRNALLEACVQDLVKIATDDDARTPSIANIMATIDSPGVRRKLRDDYSVPPVPVLVGGDALPIERETELRNRESRRLGGEFDTALDELTTDWQRFRSDVRLSAFRTWRDKVIAHSELHHKSGSYQPVDLATLGLKWGDLGAVIDELQRVVEGVGVVIRAAGYAWSMLDEQLDGAATSFWAALTATDPRRAV